MVHTTKNQTVGWLRVVGLVVTRWSRST